RRHTRFSRDWSSDVCSSDLSIADLRDVARQGAMRQGRGIAETMYALKAGTLGAVTQLELERRPEIRRGGQFQIKILERRLVAFEIGRASCRERVWVTVVAGE